MIRRRLLLLVLPLLATGCVEHIAQSRVKSALTSAGLPDGMSQCMAHRMVDRLSIKQLRKLEALQGPKRSVADYLRAVQRVNDPDAIEVTVEAAAHCAVPWNR